VSSCLDTSAAPAAKTLATSTNPKMKNTTNQTSGAERRSSSCPCPVTARPRAEAAAIAAAVPTPITELPRIFPASSARAGTAASRISTTRDCFSCTVFCMIVAPEPSTASMNTSPNARPIRVRSPLGTSDVSSS
jgi:hypothetical protein